MLCYRIAERGVSFDSLARLGRAKALLLIICHGIIENRIVQLESSRLTRPVPTPVGRFWATAFACRSIFLIRGFTFVAWRRADRWGDWRGRRPMSPQCSTPRAVTSL